MGGTHRISVYFANPDPRKQSQVPHPRTGSGHAAVTRITAASPLLGISKASGHKVAASGLAIEVFSLQLE